MSIDRRSSLTTGKTFQCAASAARLLALSTLLATVVVQPNLAFAQATGVDAILKAPGEKKKGQLTVRMRNGKTSAEDAARLVQKESHNSVVDLFMGQWLENGTFQANRTVPVLKVYALRKGTFAKAATIAAFSPMLDDILKELVAKKSKHDRTLAATTLAIYARSMASIPSETFKTKKRGGRSSGGLKPLVEKIEIDGYLKTLIDDKDNTVKELTLLAASFARSKAIAEQAGELKANRLPDLEAARQLYRVSIGQPIDDKAVMMLLRPKLRPDKQFTSFTTKLNTYEIRGHRRIYLAQAFAIEKDSKRLNLLHAWLNDMDLRVQQEALIAIEQVGDESSLPLLFKKLDETPWPIQVRALSAIGAIPAKSSIEPLIEMRGKTKGRTRQDINYALASIAAKQHGKVAPEWATWWAQAKGNFKVDKEATKKFRDQFKVQHMTVPTLAAFYGSPIISDRLVFVLDTSASMKGDKIVSLKNQMEETLANLPNQVRFNVVDFGGVVNVMYYRLMPGSVAFKAAEFVKTLNLSGGTRTYCALESGTRQTGADTLIYLSDGAPVGGQFDEWDRLIRAVDHFYRYRPLAIQTIYFSAGKGKGKGKKPKVIDPKKLVGNAAAMQIIADRNAGTLALPAPTGGVQE